MSRHRMDRRLMIGGAVGATSLALAQAPSTAKEVHPMPKFRSPMINLYSRDLARAATFYADLGFVERFRTPASGPPAHIELQLSDFTIGIATLEAARETHGLRPEGDGRWIEVVLWTDDTDEAVRELTAKGAPLLSPAHDFLDGRLRSAWIADPDGNPIQLVQRKR